LTDRIVTLIEELIPQSSTEIIVAVVSILLGTAPALRGHHLLPLAGQTWYSLDRLKDSEAIKEPRPWEEERSASTPPRMADPQADRFLRVWVPSRFAR
jgi:hypothetical protein